jgi:hypothetical protein
VKKQRIEVAANLSGTGNEDKQEEEEDKGSRLNSQCNK